VRAHAIEGWTLDNMALQTQVTAFRDAQQIRAPPKEGAYIGGLVLEGAGWNEADQSLTESTPRELFVDFPVLFVTVAPKAHKRASGDLGPFGGFECAVFRTRARREQVLTVPLPTKVHRPAHWRLRSVALLMQSDL
jgi:dynein heavy chain